VLLLSYIVCSNVVFGDKRQSEDGNSNTQNNTNPGTPTNQTNVNPGTAPEIDINDDEIPF